jgi:hypothetical protein
MQEVTMNAKNLKTIKTGIRAGKVEQPEKK